MQTPDETPDPLVEPHGPEQLDDADDLGELPLLFGRVVELEAPLSLTERLDVLGMPHQGLSPNRMVGAALGLCYRRLRSAMQREGIRYSGNPSIFGGQVIDFVCQRHGAPFGDVATLGRAALRLVLHLEGQGTGLPASKPEAEELLGNSGSTEEGSPSTS